ncbi:MAG: beta-lactamase family protein [Gemmatimonadota bacterium]|nr:beta-lactamase family protein [Gemmatimonadota bacterium]
MNSVTAACLLAVSVASCRHAQPAPDPIDDLARGADSLRAALRIPGVSLAVVRDGKVVLARGFGLADVEAGTRATAETLYPIGSITKTFTATLILQLADEGRLDLDRDVARYVDWEVAPDVRIRHVLSHTSEGVPGERFAYSSRFNWLDNVVESAAKEGFRDLLATRVLAAAGLAQTLPGEEREGYAEDLQGLAKPYRADTSGAMVRSRYPPMELHSSSGLSSTVADLALYSIALDGGRLLSPAARARAYAPALSPAGRPFPYGLGWFTQVVGGERVVWHGSWWPDAYSGLLVKVPSRQLALVLLANSDALSSPQGGASNVLLFPIANAFLRTFGVGGRELAGPARVAAALTARARGEGPKSDALLREALDCCVADLASIGDDDRLRIFGESADPVVRAVAHQAGRRLVAAFPNDLGIRFNLGMVYGQVRPALRIGGPDAEQALALFSTIVESGRPIPKWMEGWSCYLIADRIAERQPARAKVLAERALATGVDTDGLRGRLAALLRRLP